MDNILNAITDFIGQWVWIIRIGGIITAIMLINRYLLKPLKHFFVGIKNDISDIAKAYPVLEKISKDFKPNGGNSLRDVVDRIERNLFLFEQKYRAIVEFQDIGVFETDKDGRYTWVSDKWLEITNQSWVDASNNGWIAQVSSEDRDKVWHEWENAIEQARQFSMRYKVHDVPMGIKNVCSFAIPVKDKEGKLIGYLGKVSVITDKGSTGGGQYAG